MIANLAPVRGIHGRSLDGSRCRHCNDTETLPDVLGYCAHGALMRHSRHNVIRKMIADAARQKKYKVEEEMTCIAQGGSIRRLDILIIDKRTQKAWMIDPTIRFETCKDQGAKVQQEKDACIPHLKLQYNLKDIEIIGVLIGSRGTIFKEFESFRNKFDFSLELRHNIILHTINSSICLLKSHLYFPGLSL